jgi:exodeoxyribonuclease-5
MSTSPVSSFIRKFPFKPTLGQAELFFRLESFLLDDDLLRPTFLLKGYAGTGKTTIVCTLVDVIRQFGYKYVLLAPTGRAAKVMSSYARKKAFTIHKKIYWQKADPYSGGFLFERQKNFHTKTLFIVDEASMISDEADFMGAQGLLADLVDYVFEDSSNRLILVGDGAQLPPVGRTGSPALNAEYLRHSFDLSVFEHELTEVMRQEEQSGILTNATTLRNVLLHDTGSVQLQTKGFRDIFRMTGERLEDGLRYAYDKHGKENTIVVCRSNKAATQYNQYIRRQIHGTENEIDAGDYLMIVRNNYNTLDEDAVAGFLANGDFVEITKVIRFEEMHGFRFATVQLRLLDYPEQHEFEAKIILDTLHSFTPNLSGEEGRKLYEKVLADYQDIRNKKERNEAVRRDAYLNALQVKFAYALTCHKSQGGQWEAVFVDQGYLTEENVNTEFLRWLYTAMTRATQELFLMNFNPQFFVPAAEEVNEEEADEEE